MPCADQPAEQRTERLTEPKSRTFRRACNVSACISANHATSTRSFWRSIWCRYSGEPSKEVARACSIKSGLCHVHHLTICSKNILLHEMQSYSFVEIISVHWHGFPSYFWPAWENFTQSSSRNYRQRYRINET
jgi:hypothetical protein